MLIAYPPEAATGRARGEGRGRTRRPPGPQRGATRRSRGVNLPTDPMTAALPLAVLAALAQAPGPPRADTAPPTGSVAVFPAGTPVPIRFPQSLQGGREKVGAPVTVQTMAPLMAASGGCMAVGPFAPIAGTVTVSRRGALFDRGGVLQVRFDSVRAANGAWIAIRAVLDSLEWRTSGVLRSNGAVRPRGRTVGGYLGGVGAIGVAGAIVEIGVLPVVAVAGLDLVHRGGPAHILTGERGTLKLTALLMVPLAARCLPPRPPQGLAVAPRGLPAFPPHATDRSGRAGDPVNLVFRGTGAELDSAFESGGWTEAQRSTFGALAHEVEEIALARRDAAAPMSHEYYLGRVEGLRYERASPSARARHHVRLWEADSTGTVWAAAAIEDIGMLVSARRRTVTHRVAPDVDRERDLLVDDLLAGGCAALEGYTTLPGALPRGTTVAAQPYVTDMRAAVVDVTACTRADASEQSSR